MPLYVLILLCVLYELLSAHSVHIHSASVISGIYMLLRAEWVVCVV